MFRRRALPGGRSRRVGGLGGVAVGHPMSAARERCADPVSWRGDVEARLPADIVLRDVSLGYGGPVVVEGVGGRFLRGSLTAIVGPNGGGKTTLLKGLLGLVPVRAGAIESPYPRQAIAHLPQVSELDPSVPVTVEDFVSVGLWSKTGGLRAVTRPLAREVSDALGTVGLHDCRGYWMGELSGGQLQRLRFARLLVQDAPVMLLDEPFAGIDEQTTAALLRIIAAWHARRKTLIVVLHDLDLVRLHFPRTLALAGRVLAWGETGAALAALAGTGSSSA